jgi:predicted phage terminase large subunit-like protein
MSSLPAADRKQLLDELTDAEVEALLYDWRFWARPNQLPPAGNWRVWLVMAGRGFGKTRIGGEWCIDQIRHHGAKRIALVARGASDSRDVMIEGESGLMAISPPDFRPHYEPSKRRLTWPNGAIATTFGADEPNLLRGPQFDAAWCDEIATWRYPEAWDNLMLGLRLGLDPRCVATTTPRPVKLVRSLVALPTTHVTRGSTYDNLENLAPAFAEDIIRQYEGTRLGRQELGGELLEDIEGALWQYQWIDDTRVGVAPEMARIVVAVDPAATHGEDADFTGIVVAGLGVAGAYFVLRADQYRLSPSGWASRSVAAYEEFSADRIIAEINNGGEMVEHTIRQVRRDVPVKVIHASRGKVIRAEPIAALYEQGRVHHVGTFPALEDQMCAFPVANEHDDLVDATVYALTELAEGGKRRLRAL